MTRTWPGLAVIAFLTLLSGAEAQEASRNAQWFLSPPRGGGSAIASFRAWDSSATVFVGRCGVGVPELVLHYLPDADYIKVNDIGLSRRGHEIMRPATIDTRYTGKRAFVARFPVTPELLDLLKPGDEELDILADNEMEEPWHVGSAESLYRVAASCKWL